MGGPARARTRDVNGELPASADTSAIAAATEQRTRRVCWAAATRRAAAQATARPSTARPAAANAARSAAPPARCRAVTACPSPISAVKTAHRAAAAKTVHTVAEPSSPHRLLRKSHRLPLHLHRETPHPRQVRNDPYAHQVALPRQADPCSPWGRVACRLEHGHPDLGTRSRSRPGPCRVDTLDAGADRHQAPDESPRHSHQHRHHKGRLRRHESGVTTRSPDDTADASRGPLPPSRGTVRPDPRAPGPTPPYADQPSPTPARGSSSPHPRDAAALLTKAACRTEASSASAVAPSSEARAPLWPRLLVSPARPTSGGRDPASMKAPRALAAHVP